ncbi:6-phosphogluconolactonase [Bradyrhizobium sp. LHD-71]|uniref:6-phosphogluconolactonase n=1 Tax=Bradyrhizobium sp. LHD-71 TaxID=3072141 RepID=UPI002810434B|nr:6-phosphogluconolactonase [Bradyrhizobium sp. LHD-71]MDQ8727903.1 6-phosphogluconolactonase [Bradyrhizobium sp. LHD-71]
MSLKIISADNVDHLALLAAERLIALINRSERPSVCLTGGSSPLPIYKLLVAEPYASRIPWSRVHWFVGDERFVPPDDPLSNMGTARRLLLDGRAPRENVHVVPTVNVSLDDAALAYEEELRTFYGSKSLDPAIPLFDLVMLGLGTDGHAASLFPGQQTLTVTDRWVVPVPKAGLEPLVPRISLTFPALASSREVLFQVAGAAKKAIAARAMRETDLPAHRVRSQGETIWIFDPAARPDAELS